MGHLSPRASEDDDNDDDDDDDNDNDDDDDDDDKAFVLEVCLGLCAICLD